MAISIPWHPKPEWRPTYVLRKVPQVIPSSTTPSLVVTDAGNGYIKMPANPQGPAALVSELVGTMLADWFGLPTFKYALVNASPADLEPESTDTEEVPAFITMQESGEPWKGTPKELKRLSNPEVISWLVVFDTWVGNVDRYSVRMQHGELRPHRNDGNVFLSHQTEPKKLKIMAYDHTHCHFALISASPQTEIQGKIDDPAVYGNFPEFSKLIKREIVREAASKLLEFTDAESWRVVEAIPDEWLTDPSTRSRLAEFVTGRALYVADSIEGKLFPQGELNL
jgi:hypothetical protein